MKKSYLGSLKFKVDENGIMDGQMWYTVKQIFKVNQNKRNLSLSLFKKWVKKYPKKILTK